MANDYEVSVAVNVDESELKELEKSLQELKKDATVDIDINTKKADIDKFYKQLKTLAPNIKIEPKFDTAGLKKDIAEVSRFLNKALPLAAEGIDISKIFSGSESSIRQLTNKLSTVPVDVIKSLKDKGLTGALNVSDYLNVDINNEVADLLKGLSTLSTKSDTYLSDVDSKFEEFALGVSEKFNKAVTAVKQGSKEFDNSLQQVQTRVNRIENGGWEIVQSTPRRASDGGYATDDSLGVDSIITEFDNLGNKATRTIGNITQNVEVLEHSMDSARTAAETFNRVFTTEQQKTIIDVITQELQKAGVEVDNLENKFETMITSARTKFNELGRIISTSISANVNGNKITANFSADRLYGQNALQLTSATVTTAETQKLKELQQAYKELINLQKEKNQLASKGYDTTALSQEEARLEQLAQSLKDEIRNREEATRVIQQYENAVQQLNRAQQQRETEQSDKSTLTNIEAILKAITQLEGKIKSLSVGDGQVFNSNQIEVYEQQLEGLKQSLNSIGIEYDQLRNGDVSLIDLDGILQSQNAIERLRQSLVDFRQNADLADAQQYDLIDRGKVNNAVSLLEQYTKKYKELMNAMKSGDNIKAGLLTGELDQLSQDIAKAEAEFTTYGQVIKETSTYQAALAQSTQALQNAYRNSAVDAAVQSEKDKAKYYQETLKLMTQYQQKINQLSRGDGAAFNTNQIEYYKNALQGLVNSISELGIKYNSTFNSFDNDFVDASSIMRSQQAIDSLNQSITEFATTSTRIEASQQDYADEAKIKEAIKLLEQLKQKQLELAKAQFDGNASSSYINSLINDVDRLQNALNQAERAQLSYNQSVSQSSSYQSAVSSSVREAAEAYARLENSAQKAQSSSKNIQSGFDGIIGSCAKMGASFLVFDKLEDAMYSSLNAVYELNKAMVDLQMVTGNSAAQMEQMMSEYSTMAKDLGVTLQTVAQGSSEWLNNIGHYKFS